MMRPPPEGRHIIHREDMRDLSITAQIMMASSNLAGHAKSIREQIDVDSLAFHSARTLAGYDEPTNPIKDVKNDITRYRATRGMILAAGALKFLEALEKAEKEPLP
jgi:hypothetical protein